MRFFDVADGVMSCRAPGAARTVERFYLSGACAGGVAMPYAPQRAGHYGCPVEISPPCRDVGRAFLAVKGMRFFWVMGTAVSALYRAQICGASCFGASLTCVGRGLMWMF